MNRFLLVVGVALVGLIVLFGSLQELCGQAAPPRSPSPPSTPPDKVAAIGDLAWLEGAWTLQRAGETLIETWGRPEANAVAGMFRWSRGGKVWMYELMTITQEPAAEASQGGLTFRLRHFDAKLTPWEKDGPLTYGLVRSGPNEAVFEDPSRENPRRFIYRRDGDKLTVRLEAADGSGEEFTFSK